MDSLEAENQELKCDPGEDKALLEQHEKIQDDIHDLQDYKEKEMKYLSEKAADLKATTDSIERLKVRLVEVHTVASNLE